MVAVTLQERISPSHRDQFKFSGWLTGSAKLPLLLFSVSLIHCCYVWFANSELVTRWETQT
jgi:hypothetical protein